jgi:NhaA family Na+:H+ antiporter
MKATALFTKFFESERSSGLFLIACTVISLTLANSPLQSEYLKIWHFQMAGHDLAHWINDGLMTIFFLLVGLELEREVYIGELSSIKNALLPIMGAIGGMVVPAGIHLVLNAGSATQSGAGIPMATDIAFALAALSLLGKRIPISLKVFLTALAVIDDLGAILVIAIFYTASLEWFNLLMAATAFGSLLILNRLKVRNIIPYLLGGIVMWYFMSHSGIHPTISGVLLAFAIPFGNGDEKSTSYVLQRFLHRPVGFIVLPLFALANTSIVIPDNWVHGLVQLNSIGIFAGLFVGKPVGIGLFSYVSTIVGLTTLPPDLRWSHIIGAGMLGGIGFTMSIFITLLAFAEPVYIDESKIVILLSSLLSGVAGYVFLKMKTQAHI